MAKDPLKNLAKRARASSSYTIEEIVFETADEHLLSKVPDKLGVDNIHHLAYAYISYMSHPLSTGSLVDIYTGASVDNGRGRPYVLFKEGHSKGAKWFLCRYDDSVASIDDAKEEVKERKLDKERAETNDPSEDKAVERLRALSTCETLSEKQREWIAKKIKLMKPGSAESVLELVKTKLGQKELFNA